MKIQANTDAHIDGTEPSAAQVSVKVEQAVHGTAQKLAHLLNSTLGRLHDHRERTSGLPLSRTEPPQSE